MVELTLVVLSSAKGFGGGNLGGEDGKVSGDRSTSHLPDGVLHQLLVREALHVHS